MVKDGLENQIPRSHVSLDTVVYVCHSGVSVVRWDVETGECLETHRSASLLYTAANKERPLPQTG